MKKLVILILITTTLNLFSEGSNDPKNEIYRDIDRWRNIGLIERLPPIRPYSTQFIISLLKEVQKRGSKTESKKAKEYLNHYTKNSLDFILNTNNYTNLTDFKTFSGLTAKANIVPKKFATAGLDIRVYGINRTTGIITSPNRNIGIDVNEDDSSFEFNGSRIDILQSLNLNAAFGNEEFWLQTGIMPSSFGPLFDNSVVFNPNTRQSAHISYTWRHKNFMLSSMFMPLIASNNIGQGTFDDKYLHILSYDFKFTNFWEFQFYESATYGGHGIKPIFFLPFNELFYAAGMGGTSDVNSMMGASSRFQLPQNISLTGTVYADDLHMNNMLKLRFDSKMKLAAQFEINWTPKKLPLNFAKISYTAVMPYMYTHMASTTGGGANGWANEVTTEKNYENYTHYGKSIGPYGMEPNSDLVALNFSVTAPFKIGIDLNLEMRRHGNSSSPNDRNAPAGTENTIPTDGSIFDSGFDWAGNYLFQESNPFLNQSLVEQLLFAELLIKSPKIKLPSGELSADAGISYVYISNYKLVKDNLFESLFIKFSLGYKF